MSEGAPRKNESWELEVGLGECLRGKKTSLQQEVCVIEYSLLFSSVALGTAAKA